MQETQRSGTLKGIRRFMATMMIHIRIFSQLSESLRSVRAKEVLLVTEERMEKEPEQRLRIFNVVQF